MKREKRREKRKGKRKGEGKTNYEETKRGKTTIIGNQEGKIEREKQGKSEKWNNPKKECRAGRKENSGNEIK